MKKFLFGFLISFASIIMLTSAVYAAGDVVINTQNYISGSNTGAINKRGDAVMMSAGNAAGYEINFDTSPSSLILTIGTDADNAGIVEVLLDSRNGVSLGSVNTADGPFAWRGIDFRIPITQDISGKHTIWVVFKKGQHDFVSIKAKFPQSGESYYTFSEKKMFTSTGGYGAENELNLLAELGILEADRDFLPESLVTKREVIRALAGFYNETGITVSDAIYADVTPDDADYKKFATLCSMGILESKPDSKFKPDTKISLEEMCALCCKVLNFGFSDDGIKHIQLAQRHGILKGVRTNGDIRQKDMAAMLYNMIEADYGKIKALTKYKYKYDIDANILEHTRNTYMRRGIVGANPNYNIYSNDSVALANHVVIDGESYNIGKTHAASYVGFYCTYFYEESNGVKTIVAIVPDSSVEYKSLDSRNIQIEEISSDLITCYGENNKKIKLNLSDNAIFMYNGRVYSGDLSDAVGDGDFVGNILLIDNGDSSGYDVVMIEQPKTILYGGIGKNQVYDLLTKSNIKFDDKDNVVVFFDGAPIDWDELEMETVLELYASKNKSGKSLYRLYVSKEKAEGIVEEIEDGNKIRLDNGNIYESGSNVTQEIPIGRNVVLKLDSFGRYAKIEETQQIGLALFYKGGTTPAGSVLAPVVSMKCTTQDNELRVLDFADRVYADGILCTTSEELLNGKKGFEGLVPLQANTPVKYLLNSDGQVVMLDTPKKVTGGLKDSLTCVREETKLRYTTNLLHEMDDGWNTVIGLSKNYWLISLYKGGDEKTYSFSHDSISTSTSGCTLEVYKTNEESMLADLVLWIDRTSERYVDELIYEEKSIRLSEDGETEIVLKGVNRSGNVEVVVNKDKYQNDLNFKKIIDSIKNGDIVQYKTNAFEQIETILLHYLQDGASVNNAGLVPSIAQNDTTVASNYVGRGMSIFCGEVVDIEENFIKIARNTPSGIVYNIANVTAAGGVVVCEKNDRGYSIERNSPLTNIGIGSKIYVSGQQYVYSTRFIAVYK